MRSKSRTPGRRRGSMTAELFLMLPLLIGFVFMVVQFSMMIASQHMLKGAASEGARVAATGGTETEVKDAVKRYLGGGRLSCAEICVRLTDDQNRPIPAGEPVAVCVSIPTDQAAPNFLAILGYSPPHQTLSAQTVMRKE
jgi:hypothetical protein